MSGFTTGQHLDMTVIGGPRKPYLHLFTAVGVAWTRELGGILPVPGGIAETIRLQSAFMDSLVRTDRHNLLREARRMLVPGGCLELAVGVEAGSYMPRDLEKEAWLCGFEAGWEISDGKARLRKPLPPDEPTLPVSILIPAYKSGHFRQALDSALAQDWPRGEIIVGDDSPDGVIAAEVEQARGRVSDGWTLRYIRNAGTIGGRRNYLQLFERARGPLIKYLNDDDLLAPHCLRRMAEVLVHNPQVTLVTSYRRLIDGRGRGLPDEDINEPVLSEDGILDGRVLANLVLSRRTNLIGEPTTTMFRKADIADNQPHLMSYAGRSARRNGDMSIWIALLSRGDGAWLSEPLSSFRRHEGQVQNDDDFRREALVAWDELCQDGADTGLVHPSLDELRPQPLVIAGEEDPYGARARGELARRDWRAGEEEAAVFGAALALGMPGGNVDPELVLDLQDMLVSLGMEAPDAAAIGAKARTLAGAGCR